MADLSRLARLHARLLRAGDGEAPVAGQELCQACVEALAIDGAAISIMADVANRGTVAVSDPVADRIEHLQFSLGEGPCIDSFTSGELILAADWDQESRRWPAFADGLEKGTVGAVFALPLQIGAITIGVLDLYRATPGPLTPETLGDALFAADTVALALVDAAGRAAPDDSDTGLEQFSASLTTSEVEVYQATGMTSAQLEVSLEEAFARLRAHAFATGRMVDEVARDVVARRMWLNNDNETDD